VTDLGRIGGGGKDRETVWMRRDRKSSWGGRTMDCSTRKGENVKVARIGIRK
jgi:hypothetical protein